MFQVFASIELGQVDVEPALIPAARNLGKKFLD